VPESCNQAGVWGVVRSSHSHGGGGGVSQTPGSVRECPGSRSWIESSPVGFNGAGGGEISPVVAGGVIDREGTRGVAKNPGAYLYTGERARCVRGRGVGVKHAIGNLSGFIPNQQQICLMVKQSVVISKKITRESIFKKRRPPLNNVAEEHKKKVEKGCVHRISQFGPISRGN